MLLGAVEAWAAANDMRRVEALTANPQASAFYTRCGYLVVRPNDWGSGSWHSKEIAESVPPSSSCIR